MECTTGRLRRERNKQGERERQREKAGGGRQKPHNCTEEKGWWVREKRGEEGEGGRGEEGEGRPA